MRSVFSELIVQIKIPMNFPCLENFSKKSKFVPKQRIMRGHLLKMQSELTNPVHYTLHLDDHVVDMNTMIGNTVNIMYTGTIHCINCGRKTSKSFFQGYCYPCFTSLPQTDPSVIRPEKNQAHLGISRDMEWSKKHDLIDHVVYLALSGGLKVGVTRHTQIPTRWIDQGARSAVALATTPHRNMAGQLEVELKKHMNDKTNWRAMLTNKKDGEPQLEESIKQAIDWLPDEFKKYINSSFPITTINYPVDVYPAKVKSVNLDKNPNFTGVLEGIRGQYLIFNDGIVLNVRKYNGYEVELSFES
jgi:hypothetical protein